MKLKIEEQRGKFRIMQKLKGQWFFRGLHYYIDEDDADFTWDDEFLDEPRFGSYEETEEWIKEHFGIEGVKCIVKPKWKTV